MDRNAARAALLATPEPVPFTWISPKGQKVDLLLVPVDLDEAERGSREQAQYEARSIAWQREWVEAKKTGAHLKLEQPKPPNASSIMLDVVIRHTLLASTREPVFEAADKAALSAGGSMYGSLFKALCNEFRKMAAGPDPEEAKIFAEPSVGTRPHQDGAQVEDAAE